MCQNMEKLKTGDYAYIKNIGSYNDSFTYISIIKDYDEKSRTATEFASIVIEGDDDINEIIFYHSKTANIREIRKASAAEKEYMDNLLQDDGVRFDKETLSLIHL